MKGIFIDLKDIMTIRGVKKSRAGDLIQLMRETFGKKRSQKITVKEYCDYEGITIDQFLDALKEETNHSK